MRDNIIVDYLCKCIDGLAINDFMKGYITALVVNSLFNDHIIKSFDRTVNEVDIPDFCKREFSNN